MSRDSDAPVLHPDPERRIREALASIRFGSVTLVVQDGRVVQIDKSEKVRLAGLGIDEKTPVVVYGNADKSWGGEGYDVWLLSWLGHKGPIRLLNGGIQAWKGMNPPLVEGAERPGVKMARYQAALKQHWPGGSVHSTPG